MKDKMIHIRLDEKILKELKHLLVDMDISIQIYVEGLIKNDLREN